jgi:hypothetical protein
LIVLDDQLSDPRIQRAIARWYPGTVTHVEQLRPLTRILDDAIPSLLHHLKAPTFVTIN